MKTQGKLTFFFMLRCEEAWVAMEIYDWTKSSDLVVLDQWETQPGLSVWILLLCAAFLSWP
jgi:hypothetical protein